MSDAPIKASTNHRTWLTDIKRQFRQTQLKAAVRVNSELRQFYWQLGCCIVEQQRYSQWADGLLAQFTHDLMPESDSNSLAAADKNFYRDLLFYHLILRCYVVIQLRTGDFIPEYAGKMNFHLTAADKQLKQEQDTASIGLLLFKHRGHLVAEYALGDVHKPIGITEYQLTQSLPDNLKSNLPSVEVIEAELSADWGDGDE